MFSKLRELFFGRKITVETHSLEDFPFDTLTKKEAKEFFLKSGNVIHLNREAVLEKLGPGKKGEQFIYLDNLFKFSWCKYWALHSVCDLKITTSDNFILLSYDNERRNKILLKFAENSYDTILKNLGEIITEAPVKHLIFHLTSNDYYALEDTIEKPESDGGVLTGGMFVPGAVPYMVFHSEIGMNLPDIVLAHELTHALLSFTQLPLWLDEAMACTMEKTITGECHYDWTLETGLKNIEYWDFETIQHFWIGESFFVNDSQEYSYLLAQGLMNIIVRDFKDSFRQFVRHARKQDSGEAAARKYLGVSLGEIANRYMGEGPWKPSLSFLDSYYNG